MPDISNDDIVYFGQRVEPYFASSIVAGGLGDADNLKRRFDLGGPVGWFEHLSSSSKHNYDFFNIKSELMQFLEAVHHKLEREHSEYVDKILADCLSSGEALVALGEKLFRERYREDMKTEDVAGTIITFTEAARDFCIFYTIAFFDKPELEIVKAIVDARVPDKAEREALMTGLTTANKRTDTDLEQEAFYHLAAQSYPSKSAKRKAAGKHAKQHGWLGVRFFIGEWWNEDDVIARLALVSIDEASRAQHERKELHDAQEKAVISFTDTLSDNEKSIVNQMRTMVFLRTQRADFFHHASALIKPFAVRAASLLKVSYHDLLYFSPEEVTDALRGAYTLGDELQKRSDDMLMYLGAGRHIAVLSGEDATAYTRERAIFDRREQATGELRGVTAYKGTVRGNARIVFTHQDSERVKRGDVLVSTMTTPNFIAAMERAAAFITDEGGILCHAAIVAREMKKPCIIATKKSTRVLHDGDLVEVDADNGVVRVLERAGKEFDRN